MTTARGLAQPGGVRGDDRPSFGAVASEGVLRGLAYLDGELVQRLPSHGQHLLGNPPAGVSPYAVIEPQVSQDARGTDGHFNQAVTASGRGGQARESLRQGAGFGGPLFDAGLPVIDPLLGRIKLSLITKHPRLVLLTMTQDAVVAVIGLVSAVGGLW